MPIAGCQYKININNINEYKENYFNLISLNNIYDDYEFAKV